MRFLLVYFCFAGFSLFASTATSQEPKQKSVLIAILARNKAHVLSDYLTCIERLDYDKKAITLYINSNNNEDATETLLSEWSNKWKGCYSKIILDFHSVENLASTDPHEWTPQRFKVLGMIRNKSMQMALQEGCDFYFVVDCDNFLVPCTLKELVQKDKPIVAPMLVSVPEKGDPYSNYFCAVNEWGYYQDHPNYRKILRREMVGAFEVPVVHCTYLIKKEYINSLTYVDGSEDFEFVIFSKSARKNQVSQYICNEKSFGTLLHFFNDVSMEEEKARVRAYGSLIP